MIFGPAASPRMPPSRRWPSYWRPIPLLGFLYSRCGAAVPVAMPGDVSIRLLMLSLANDVHIAAFVHRIGGITPLVVPLERLLHLQGLRERQSGHAGQGHIPTYAYEKNQSHRERYVIDRVHRVHPRSARAHLVPQAESCGANRARHSLSPHLSHADATR